MGRILWGRQLSSPGVKYEFDGEENAKFEQLIVNLRRFLAPLCVFAMLQIVVAFGMGGYRLSAMGEAASPYSVLFAVVCGFLTVFVWQATKDFRKIVDTEGSDVEHLISALEKVKRSFLASSIILAATIVALGAAILELVSQLQV